MSDIINRVALLPWPLFLRVLAGARIPSESFSIVDLKEQKEFKLRSLVGESNIFVDEMERALQAIRPGMVSASTDQSGGDAVTGTGLFGSGKPPAKHAGPADAGGDAVPKLEASGSSSNRRQHQKPANAIPWSDQCFDGGAKILHLSDLHLNEHSDAKVLVSSLCRSLNNYKPPLRPHYVVVSGDFTDRGNVNGFKRAVEFLNGVKKRLTLKSNQFILVPGNHDVVDNIKAYERCRETPSEADLRSKDFIKLNTAGGGSVYFKKNLIEYRKRFAPFAEKLYRAFLRRSYPLHESEQAHVYSFEEHSLQFLTFNSAWEIDEFNRRRSGLLTGALEHLGDQIERKEKRDGRDSNRGILRIAVCHHPVLGPGQMQNTPFMDTFQEMNVKIVMHGDVHELNRCDYLGFRPHRRIHVVGSGAFDAKKEDRPESTPRLLNFLEISKDHRFLRVHTLNRSGPDSDWKPMTNWIPPGERDTKGLSYFVVDLDRGYD